MQALPVEAPQWAAREPGSEMAWESGRPRVELERRLLAHWEERAALTGERVEQPVQRPKRLAQELAARQAGPAALRAQQA